MKVFIINGNGQYERMFIVNGWEVVDNVAEADLVQFCGGEDVNPALYGQEVHPRTFYNEQRDVIEAQYYELAKRNGKPMAGICRGGQFLNVCNGGSLFQHVDHHAIGGTHSCEDLLTGKLVDVSSTHHQMMRAGPEGHVVATAARSTFKQVMVGGVVEDVHEEHPADVEVVYYHDTDTLCFQPHPEFAGVGSCTDYYFELLERCLGLKA